VGPEQAFAGRPLRLAQFASAAITSCLVCTNLAIAQGSSSPAAYPVKTVRILVGWAPGGAVDLMGRYYAKAFGEVFKQPFIVENRPGAASNIATDLVAKSSPDGYNLLMNSVVHSINPGLYGKLPFDAVRDFTAIAPVALAPNAILVNNAMPVKTLRELIALAKARPGEIAYASSGGGTLQRIGMEMFNAMAGIKLIDVPFSGTGPAITAVIGGQVPVLSSGYGSALPFIGNAPDRLRVLAITTAERSPLAPDVPTVVEAAGLTGYESVSWMGLIGPAGMAPEVVARLNAEAGRLTKTAETREWLARQGLAPYYLTPAAFAEKIRLDVAGYGKVIRDIGAKPD
jgi:tripartite-type tricarboxylate transporter receptor subunit TctC